MTIASIDRLLRTSRLALPTIGRDDDFRADRSIRMLRSDSDRLEGKVKQGRTRSGAGGTPKAPRPTTGAQRETSPRGQRGESFGGGGLPGFDKRQRAIVKVHYFNHAGGGVAALKAHTRYIARDAAARDDLSPAAREKVPSRRDDCEQDAKAHASYLSRTASAERVAFYDATSEGVDGAARAEAWARSDKRHFRVILSAENGDRLRDLPAYTREVMTCAEAALRTKLQWVAVDHWDTAHPHTHLIIRGRKANGQDLIIPKEFVRFGFSGIAREVATETLGARSPADERRAIAREVPRCGPTRLDRMIAAQLPSDRTIRIAKMQAPNGDADMTRALKARARELQRMGLAREAGRNVLTFNHDWRDRLAAMELHLDARKRLMQERALQRTRQELAPGAPGRAWLGR